MFDLCISSSIESLSRFLTVSMWLITSFGKSPERGDNYFGLLFDSVIRVMRNSVCLKYTKLAMMS